MFKTIRLPTFLLTLVIYFINLNFIDTNLINLDNLIKANDQSIKEDKLIKSTKDDKISIEINESIDNSSIYSIDSIKSEKLLTNSTDEEYVDLNDINSSLSFYGYFLSRFRIKFISLHGYISELVCFFGIIANILNIIVLTR